MRERTDPEAEFTSERLETETFYSSVNPEK